MFSIYICLPNLLQPGKYCCCYYFTPSEYFIPASAGGLSLKSKWQQVSSGLLDSSQYTNQSQKWSRFFLEFSITSCLFTNCVESRYLLSSIQRILECVDTCSFENWWRETRSRDFYLVLFCSLGKVTGYCSAYLSIYPPVFHWFKTDFAVNFNHLSLSLYIYIYIYIYICI